MQDTQTARQYAAQINYELDSHAFVTDFGFASHVTDTDNQDYEARNI